MNIKLVRNFKKDEHAHYLALLYPVGENLLVHEQKQKEEGVMYP